MRRLISSVLALALMGSLALPGLAAQPEESYTLTILANGNTQATVEQGSELTVALTLSKDGADQFVLYNMQDYVCFDPEYFSFVENSIQVYTVGEGASTPVVQASVIKFPGSATQLNRVFVNRAGSQAQNTDSGETIVSFRLKALKVGKTTLSHDKIEVFLNPMDHFAYTQVPAQVTIEKKDSGGGGGGTGGGGGGTTESFVIAASAQQGGTISPSGNVSVNKGKDQTFTIRPDPGYEIQKVLVDGESVGTAASYTFRNVTARHTIQVWFQLQGGSDPLSGFVDVPKDAWYRPGVEYVCARGLMAGTSATTFSPDMVTTRGMIVTILHSLEGKPQAAPAGFEDMTSSDWYGSAVAWAAANGIVSGYSSTAFGPNDPITREQMAAILLRYAQFKGCDVTARADLSGYKDVGQISGYALTAMQWAGGEGLISGVSADLLAPQGSATRAQVAQILMQFCKNVLN